MDYPAAIDLGKNGVEIHAGTMETESRAEGYRLLATAASEWTIVNFASQVFRRAKKAPSHQDTCLQKHFAESLVLLPH